MPTKEFPKKTIAAIDIGTNSAHMVIAQMDHVGEMRVLDSDKVTLRLGQAIDASGNLTDDAMRRTVEALKHMRQIIVPYIKGGGSIRAVATHATREAKNHKRLLQEIQRQAGIKVEMIDGIEEARLVFLGMRYGLALSNVACLGVDVGGGSTEIIVARDDEIDYVSSFKLGAVTLTAKYFGEKGPTPEAFAALREHVRSRLAPLPQEARRFPYAKALASSGTAKALAYLHAKLYLKTEMSDPNGYVLPRDDLFKISADLEKLLTPPKIKEATGLDQSRSEIIAAGTVVLEELTRVFKVKEWIITSYGLREGLVADTFYRAYGERSGDLPDIQWHSVLQFAKRLQLNEVHAIHVKRLALRLYELLAPVLNGTETEEDRDANVKVLKATAYLREAGKFISTPQYHRHSQYLISNSRLPGFTEAERSFMGLIARFQRKGLPSADHQDCSDLQPNDVKRLRSMAAILRLAAALDRTRQNRVAGIDLKVDKDGLTFVLHHDPTRPPDVEVHKAKLEKNALEKSFEKPVKFELSAMSPGSRAESLIKPRA